MPSRKYKTTAIKPADKGSAIVTMDKEDYRFEAMRQLQDKEFYRPLQGPIYLETQNEIIKLLKQLKMSKHINQKQLLFLTGTNPPRPSESYGSAKLINHYLKPLAIKHPSYIKDTGDFLQKVSSHNVTESSLLFTMDVESLYMSMGLEAIKECLNENPDPDRPDKIIMELLKINLERNYFKFDDGWFLQTKGTAMGKRFSPAYANIYMAKWEKECFQKCEKLPEAYYRYLDDIWGIWNHNHEDLDHFTTILNNHHPSIRIKLTCDLKQVVFLNTVIFKGENFQKTGKLDSKTHFKNTDSHQLLHRHSFHPKYTFTGILKTQLIRFNRTCSNTTDRDMATQTLFQALHKQGYPRSLLQRVKKELQREVPQAQNWRIISAYQKNPSLKDLLVRANFKRSRRPTRTHHLPFIWSTNNNKHWTISQRITGKHENIIYGPGFGPHKEQWVPTM
ncbi:hypothetical protein CCH79_00013957 [Gambusia affinis]|uniref:Uncharacterized protein n=1 Tax=Gambusia affinis TaxID=33528 RepID=A0A315W105_GAMAF|nr:hypothetical protein CCH79_00013957 [Gambusia affinis]